MRRVLIVLLALVLLSTGSGCFGRPKPPHDCPPGDLLLDHTSFPAGAKDGEILSPLPDIAVASAGRAVYLAIGLAVHDVYQHVSPERAARDFEERQRDFSRRRGGPWTTPAEFTYRSPIADQYCVACGIESSIYMCEMVARYHEYCILLTTQMHNPQTGEVAMTFADLQRAIQDIDERMGECLGQSSPAATVTGTTGLP